MIAVDTNVLVYAHRKDSEWHAKAVSAVRAVAEGRAPWALPWPCVNEFVAIVTHPKIYAPPSTLPQALAQVEAWLESPSLILLSESENHFPKLQDLLTKSRSVGPRVHDARIATLCLEHEVDELWTADRDFARFPGLVTKNPLVA
jgi:toxin-antitoxin system PIN domain toxin